MVMGMKLKLMGFVRRKKEEKEKIEEAEEIDLKRELGDLREELSKLDDSLKDMMALYEIVSAQINPFVGSSKVTSLSIERLDEMEKRIEELEFLIDSLTHDVKLMFKKSLSVKDIVNKVLYEEVLS